MPAQIKPLNFRAGDVIKLTDDQELKLQFEVSKKDTKIDVWTNWSTGKWHSVGVENSQILLLPCDNTGIFELIFRVQNSDTKKMQETDVRLEVQIEPDWIYDAIVYNVFLRAYGAKSKDKLQPGEGGTFQDVIRHMDELIDIGINVLYLNPFHRIGELYRKHNPNDHLPYYLQPGSPYSIKDYKSIDPEVAFRPHDKRMLLTNPERQFRKLVDAAHKRGMRVMMDLVFNHTAHDFVLQRFYPEWYLYKEHIDSGDDLYLYPEDERWGDPKYSLSPYDYGQFCWQDTAQLNWEYKNPPAPNDPPPNSKKKEMYDYFKSVPKYWVKNFGIDAFRCDAAYKIPMDFWHQCIIDSKKAGKEFYPQNGAIDGEVIFVGESRQDDLELLQQDGFSHLYGDFANKLNKPLHLKGYLDYMYNLSGDYFPPNSKWFIFPECHDFDRATSKYLPAFTLRDEDSGLSDTQEKAMRGNASRWVLTACLPGMPMVFTGFEKVEWQQVDHVSYSRINWKKSEDILPIIKKVNHIRHAHVVLQKGDYQFMETNQGVDEETQVYAFARCDDDEIIIVVVNMDIYNQAEPTIKLPAIKQFDPNKKFILKDLITGKIYDRGEPELFIKLKPGQSHIFLVEQNWG